MNIGEEQRGDVILLAPEGRLDSNTAPAFEARLMERIKNGGTRLVIDFSQLDYVSSAGLRVLLMAAKRLKAAKGSLALCSMKEYIHKVFKISGFLPIFTVVDDIDAAIAAVSS